MSQPLPEDDNNQGRKEDRIKTETRRGRQRHHFTILIFFCSCMIALTLSIWDPFHIKRKPTYLGPDLTRLDEEGDLRVGELAPFKFEPLPLGSIEPQGWVQDQLELMAHGMAGHLYDFYHVVKHSPWLGGHTEYAKLNEGLPYWFNGLVPLAYGLNDKRLQSQVLEVTEEVLKRQSKDGWLGPERGHNRSIWARFPLCLGLMQLAEAEPAVAGRVIAALHRFVQRMHSMLKDDIAYRTFWGRVRYPDMLVTLHWLYEKHPQNNTRLLMDTMRLLRRQGFDWPEFWTKENFLFADLDTITPAIEEDTYKFRHSHAVNVGQGLSAGAALYRSTKNESHLEANRRGVKWTFEYHGDVAGNIIGDERESGLAPNRGSELCTASETMYSLSYLYHVMGDKDFADQCELATFNAWPVSITADHWARQYLAVANAPFAKRIFGPLNFWNTGLESLVYGLDTNYPCCTVNMPQGLPKFLSASFVRVGTDGIGHALLGPVSVRTTTRSGVSVNITCDTKYPFGLSLVYRVQASGPITLHLRAPAWVGSSPTIAISGEEKALATSPDDLTGMTSISLGAGQHALTYNLDASIRVVPRANSSVAIYHGALLYALDIGQTQNYEANTPQVNVTYNKIDGSPEFPDEVKKIEMSCTDPWNIGIDPDTLDYHSAESEKPLANPIFDYQAPPSYIKGKGCPVEWPVKNGLPSALSALPEGQSKRKCDGPLTEVILRPYGSLKVHMAELPVVDLGTASA